MNRYIRRHSNVLILLFTTSEHAIKAGYWIFPAVDLADGHMEWHRTIGKDLYAVEPQTNVVSLWAAKSDP